MNYPEEIAGNFRSISLDEINLLKDSVKLLKRYDTKFVFSSDKLGSLLKMLIDHYRILEIEGNRVFGHENLYFDTDDFIFYRQYHRRKLNRYKMRFRRYTDSGEILNIIKKVVTDDFNVNFETLRPVLFTGFSRITLANLNLKKRLTIDTNIEFKNESGLKKNLKGIAVAEFKQADISLISPFVMAAKANSLYQKPFSKYCTGISLLEKSVKVNSFKRRLLFLEKITM